MKSKNPSSKRNAASPSPIQVHDAVGFQRGIGSCQLGFFPIKGRLENGAGRREIGWDDADDALLLLGVQDNRVSKHSRDGRIEIFFPKRRLSGVSVNRMKECSSSSIFSSATKHHLASTCSVRLDMPPPPQSIHVPNIEMIPNTGSRKTSPPITYNYECEQTNPARPSPSKGVCRPSSQPCSPGTQTEADKRRAETVVKCQPGRDETAESCPYQTAPKIIQHAPLSDKGLEESILEGVASFAVGGSVDEGKVERPLSDHGPGGGDGREGRR